MYGLGISEIAVIFLVLLLFFRPEEIFSFLRKTGQWYSRVDKVQKDMEDLINKGFSDPEGREDFGFDADKKDKDKRSDISQASHKDSGEGPDDYKEIYRNEFSEDFDDDEN